MIFVSNHYSEWLYKEIILRNFEKPVFNIGYKNTKKKKEYQRLRVTMYLLKTWT